MDRNSVFQVAVDPWKVGGVDVAEKMLPRGQGLTTGLMAAAEVWSRNP